MPTYGSPKIIKYSLLIINSIIFLMGWLILINGIISEIDSSEQNQKGENFDLNFDLNITFDDIIINNKSFSEDQVEFENTITTEPPPIDQDHFPSVASPFVKILFGVMTIVISSWGIEAVITSNRRLLITYSFMLIIGFFIRFLFLIATVRMHAFNTTYDPITIITLISATIMIVELILIMCVCHFAKIVKRGDAAAPNLQKLPSYD